MWSLLLAIVTMSATAQTDEPQAQPQPQSLRFGYLNFDSVLVSVPGYTEAQQQLAELRDAYEKEMKRVENEFNAKYEAFLEGQSEFPRTILLKRQQELQDMLQQNIAFKNKCRSELAQKEAEVMARHRAIVKSVVASHAKAHQLAFVLNTAGDACPYLDTDQGIDLEEEVRITLMTYGNTMVDEDGEVLEIVE